MNKQPIDRSMRVNVSIKTSHKPILDKLKGSKWIQWTLENEKLIQKAMAFYDKAKGKK